MPELHEIAESLTYENFKTYVKESSYFIPFFGRAVKNDTYGDLDEKVPVKFKQDFLKSAHDKFLNDWQLSLIQYEFKKDLNAAYPTSDRNLPPIWIFHLKTSGEEPPGGIFQDSSLLIYERKNVSVTAKKLRPNQRHKIECRKIATQIWEKEPKVTIAAMILRDEISNACETTVYAESTLRDWIKDLSPDRSPGRRPGKK